MVAHAFNLRRQRQADLEFENTPSSVEGFEKSGDGRMKYLWIE